MIPARTKAALDHFARTGNYPGGFCTAVLENKFAEALCNADSENLAAIQEIALYLYNQLPSACWGSVEKVAKYSKEVGPCPDLDEENDR
jgi:hypothetical protein